MNAPKRRDRFGKKPALNDRGQPIHASVTGHQPAILRSLAQHGTLTLYDVHAIIGGNLQAVQRAIRRLRDEPNEYVRVIPEQTRVRNLHEKLYYQLAPRGVEWLNNNGGHVEPPKRVYNLAHTGLVSHIMASITAGVAQHASARLISWEEMQTHHKFPQETRTAKDNTAVPHPTKGHIRPDTHPFGIELTKEGKNAYRFFVIEADNGTETIKPSKPAEYTGNSIYAKFEAYLDFIESKGFHARYGLPNYFVLFVFTNRTRMDNAKALLASMTRGGSRYILFQLANQEEGIPGYIFTSTCERVGYETLFLNQA
jgi:hypothetical protein